MHWRLDATPLEKKRACIVKVGVIHSRKTSSYSSAARTTVVGTTTVRRSARFSLSCRWEAVRGSAKKLLLCPTNNLAASVRKYILNKRSLLVGQATLPHVPPASAALRRCGYTSPRSALNAPRPTQLSDRYHTTDKKTNPQEIWKPFLRTQQPWWYAQHTGGHPAGELTNTGDKRMPLTMPYARPLTTASGSTELPFWPTTAAPAASPSPPLPPPPPWAFRPSPTPTRLPSPSSTRPFSSSPSDGGKGGAVACMFWAVHKRVGSVCVFKRQQSWKAVFHCAEQQPASVHPGGRIGWGKLVAASLECNLADFYRCNDACGSNTIAMISRAKSQIGNERMHINCKCPRRGTSTAVAPPPILAATERWFVW